MLNAALVQAGHPPYGSSLSRKRHPQEVIRRSVSQSKRLGKAAPTTETDRMKMVSKVGGEYRSHVRDEVEKLGGDPSAIFWLEGKDEPQRATWERLGRTEIWMGTLFLSLSCFAASYSSVSGDSCADGSPPCVRVLRQSIGSRLDAC